MILVKRYKRPQMALVPHDHGGVHTWRNIAIYRNDKGDYKIQGIRDNDRDYTHTWHKTKPSAAWRCAYLLSDRYITTTKPKTRQRIWTRTRKEVTE